MKKTIFISLLLTPTLICALPTTTASIHKGNTITINTNVNSIPSNYSSNLSFDYNDWTKNLVAAKPIIRTWNGDITTNISQMISLLNLQMQFNLQTKIDNMSPYQLGKYLVDFYNHNTGGIFTFQFNYKNQQNNVSANYEQKLRDLIAGFNGITQDTKKATGTPLLLALDIAKKLSDGSIDPAKALLQFFGSYGQDVFDMNFIQLATFLLQSEPATPIQARAYEIMRLMDALPGAALKAFPGALAIFTSMGSQMLSSPLTQEWAKDNNISSEFATIDHILINEIMHSGS